MDHLFPKRRQNSMRANLKKTSAVAVCNDKNRQKGETVGLLSTRFFANRNGRSSVAYGSRRMVIKTHELDHFEKAGEDFADLIIFECSTNGRLARLADQLNTTNTPLFFCGFGDDSDRRKSFLLLRCCAPRQRSNVSG